MGPCCVEGCSGIGEDTVYFEFPTSRGLRRKWLEMLKIPSKIPLGTMVCSRHFNRDSYEIVRGKVRLKRKVVPTLQLYNKNSKLSENETPKSPPLEETEKVEKVSSEKSELPKPDSTTDNVSLKPDEASENVSLKPDEANDKETKEDITEEKVQDEDVKSEDICKVNSMDIEQPPDKIASTPLPDPKQPPDFEEMITNYQIKNSKPHSLVTMVTEQIEVEVPQVADEAIIVDDKGDAPPVYIEINYDKDNNTANPNSEDCLMVLESVQVDIDPGSLMLPERESDDDDCEIQDKTDKKDDPISLLTSSDEDDVIIQEPHIDTVEVSSTTDEDDVPLVKLLKKKPVKKKKKVKQLPPPGTDSLQRLVWSGVYDFYCMQCHFTTSDSIAYNNHVQDHHKILQVCHICAYTTASKAQLTRHIRKHKEEKKFKCHLCDYKARHNMSLIYHMQLHEKDGSHIKSVKKGFKCQKCSYRSDDRSVVMKHARLCGVKKFACDQCVYVTKRKSDLKRHWTCRHENKVVTVDSDGSCTGKWE